jgi:ribosomal protein L19E
MKLLLQLLTEMHIQHLVANKQSKQASNCRSKQTKLKKQARKHPPGSIIGTQIVYVGV